MFFSVCDGAIECPGASLFEILKKFEDFYYYTLVIVQPAQRRSKDVKTSRFWSPRRHRLV